MLHIFRVSGRKRALRALRLPQVQHRHIFTQDAILGLENKLNFERLLTTEKSGGPALIMNASEYGVDIPFHNKPKVITKTDDTLTLFKINDLGLQPHHYCDFVSAVFKQVQIRNGLLEASFQFTETHKQWNPDRLISFLTKHDIKNLLKLDSQSLFFSYLKRTQSQEKLLETFTDINANFARKSGADYSSLFVDGDMNKGLTLQVQQSIKEKLEHTDENLISFTDAEYGFLFFCLEPHHLYNLACVTNGGHFITTEDVRQSLHRLLNLKVLKKTEDYEKELQFFKQLTRGDFSTPPRSRKIADMLKNSDVIRKIYAQNSDFLVRNFESLCIKLDAYLLNKVSASQGLLVTLSFAQPDNTPPILSSFLLGKSDEDQLTVSELFLDKDNPFSLFAPNAHEQFEQSINRMGTPSANICIVDNANRFFFRSLEIGKSVEKPFRGYSLKKHIQGLFDLITDHQTKVSYLSGVRMDLDLRWYDFDRCIEIFTANNILTLPRELKQNPPFMAYQSIPLNENLDYEDIEIVSPNMPENYNWYVPQVSELPMTFSTDRQVNTLPKTFKFPTHYSQHLGAKPD